ncbi:hypothetical protein AJ85_17915 [Alkalihalobacillus alcalophilus ATCC 27647 = CGMCC 1.3604]|uniref:Uncharacterized protein n=1 Tax=Alkalihalobacillus alcalophilus ATCC 27647 = CGMCC 1.3604 TaxID=1218173 RepID=A0A094XJ48_ALKAL|nr:hypothetical protein [Alkalihalobacillus alcalophilus]KGA98750.1 hypothetical protein BALCAV_0202245 [Alkalihalobacillus alcalophilus ATCC 27647 = CGMCC 1.3604]MED1562656.1 hypothetical protein [Alkalihalobacillus alcalophilus]THG89401.1 hypothetical protein AJ85_17915 [Alkalihalobacillus alcalophilus ATCC 27647 = CGMCC 1.3604]
MHFIKEVCFYLLLISLLGACSVPIEESLEEAEQVFYDSLEQESMEPNVELEQLAIYVPELFDVIRERDHNIVIGNGDDLIVFFYLPLTETDDRRLLEQEIRYDAHTLLLVEERADNAYFLSVKEQEGNKREVELTVGRGNAKLTKLTNANDLVEDTEQLLQMIHSYEIFE